MSDAEKGKIFAEYRTFTTEPSARRRTSVAGDQLKGTDTATTVRIRDGKMMKTHGPFAETREQGRLLPHRGQGSRRGVRHRRSHPERALRLDRGASDQRHVSAASTTHAHAT
ncbi:MAG: hypothetical protein U0235_21965 [Polyangiaceae bacterium]